MKRAMLGVLVLAVCGLMVAPMVWAKPGGGAAEKKFSLLSGDFVDISTVGEWRFQETEWSVGWSNTLHPPGPGGPIVIYDSPNAISNYDADSGRYYVAGDTHGEVVGFGGLKLRNIPTGIYTVPGDGLIKRVFFMVQINNFVVGENNNVLLAALMDTNKFHQGSGDTVTVRVTNAQVIISGNHVHFHYENWRIVIVPDQPLYGHADQDFEIVIDK